MSAYTFGIDTRWLESRTASGGTAVYIRELVRAMLQLDRGNRYHLWGTPLTGVGMNAHNFPFTGKQRRAWQLIWKTAGWPTVDLPGPPCDLWHFTNYVAPPTRKPFVVTVHDMAFVDHPAFVEPKNLRYLERFVPETLTRAAHIIAVSDATRNSLAEHFNVPLTKITVTHEAADERFSQPPEPERLSRILKKHGIDRDYILTVGTLEPRKNLKTLLLAFAALRKKVREQLVVVGGHGWLFDETEELLRKLGLGDRVILTGYVPDEELPSLYAGAKAFVFPSHLEGFGIPLLEAMASGTPVLSSNTSSMPEVGGTAALYFDPDDEKGMRLAIERVLGDEKLQERLAEAGYEQAKQFSWERTAQKTLGVYFRALGLGNVRVPKAAPDTPEPPAGTVE
ncbi:MAG: glycosyltransferase family 4 protein [bacterium]|nr:glycosyltransferase family 4 protein [bacterium]